MAEINPFAGETSPTERELQAELTSLDRRRFYILSLMGKAQRQALRGEVQLTFIEELDGQDDDGQEAFIDRFYEGE